MNLIQFIGNENLRSIVNRIYFSNNTYSVLYKSRNINRPDLLSLSFSKFMKSCFKSTLFQKLAGDIVNEARDSGFYLS